MIPDWKDAPEWAQWLAMDKNGVWYWYELKPLRALTAWVEQSDSMIEPVVFRRKIGRKRYKSAQNKYHV